MKSLTIKIDSIDKVKEFVNIINVFDGEFDLVSDRYVIDAKSIMGIFSLDISSPVRLDVHDEATFDEVAKALDKFKA
ncbi:MAG: HPr family phosphocarrier protein [Firmicutes bacterium]|nr:HPr family phosphocarrier protein [Bacillota bacterium]